MKIQKILSDTEVEKEFIRFETIAKEPFIKDFEIRDELINFFDLAGYFRTPYKIFPTLVFRARATSVDSISEAENIFKRTRDLSYPNQKVIHKVGQGRCNKSGEAVFYSSNENGVPVFEVRPKVGDYIVIAAFRSKASAHLTVQAPIIGVKQIRDNMIKNNRGTGWITMLNKDWLFLTSHQHLIKIDDLLSEWFMKTVDSTNRHFYRLTTIIYKIFTEHTLYGGNVLMDGLIYPSVASEATGVNLALKTNFVDNDIDFFGAGIYHYEQFNANHHMELKWLKQAWGHEIKTDDNLIWKNVLAAKNLLTLGTDFNPKEFPQFNPDQYIAGLGQFSITD